MSMNVSPTWNVAETGFSSVRGRPSVWPKNAFAVSLSRTAMVGRTDFNISIASFDERHLLHEVLGASRQREVQHPCFGPARTGEGVKDRPRHENERPGLGGEPSSPGGEDILAGQ